jgi:acetyl esterase
MDQFYLVSHYLAGRGMVAICADYRVHSREQVTPFECLQDAKSTMRWARGHAAGGGSAGGHLAAATATTTGFNTPGEVQTVSCRPDGQPYVVTINRRSLIGSLPTAQPLRKMKAPN